MSFLAPSIATTLSTYYTSYAKMLEKRIVRLKTLSTVSKMFSNAKVASSMEAFISVRVPIHLKANFLASFYAIKKKFKCHFLLKT